MIGLLLVYHFRTTITIPSYNLFLIEQPISHPPLFLIEQPFDQGIADGHPYLAFLLSALRMVMFLWILISLYVSLGFIGI